MKFRLTVLFALFLPKVVAADEIAWPKMPSRDGGVLIPAQEWPQQPGPRSIRIRVAYPGGKLSTVNQETGIMLTLHNWGGEDCAGTANPNVLAKRLNVVAVCVNYLQSGRKASIEDPEPYDCGYLQALDALRALWFVRKGLQQNDVQFDSGRIYCTGGSGGGNVTQMAVKLAPRTFACVVDMCGMKKLSHDIAFNLPGGSGLDARWSRNPASPNYLSVDEQEIRFIGHSQHLATRKQLGSKTKIIIVHGVDDRTCAYEDAVELAENMKAAKLDVEPRFISKDDLDGKIFTSSGHALGNRTEIVIRVALKYLNAKSGLRVQQTDFDQRQDVVYQTSNGSFVISYKHGFPIGKFEPEGPPIKYSEHLDLTYFLDGNGQRHGIKTPEDWLNRRRHVLANLQLAMGKLPNVMSRVPLSIRNVDSEIDGNILRRNITFQSDPYDRVSAYLLTSKEVSNDDNSPAILCLQQTTPAGKDEPAGLAGKANMHYGIELARRGYVVLIPDYPTFGEHQYDFKANPEYVSVTMKAIWDNIRCIDLLQSLPYVDGNRIGVIGHSLGGHNAMFTAAFEPRLKAIVSSCGFTRFHKDDVPSWTGPRYMPRIATIFNNDADKVPFDFPEIVATFAPRPFLAIAATKDNDFDVSGVQDTIRMAMPVYSLFDSQENLRAIYLESPHDFPPAAREQAYQFLDKNLGRRR